MLTSVANTHTQEPHTTHAHYTQTKDTHSTHTIHTKNTLYTHTLIHSNAHAHTDMTCILYVQFIPDHLSPDTENVFDCHE